MAAAPSRPELFDHVIALPSLRAAYALVRERDGPAGIDKETPAGFGRELEARLQRLHDELSSGQYRCMPLLRFQLKKKHGGQRPLAICAVRDRIVQRAILAVLAPLFEQRFLDCSHAYRPNHSPHTALKQIERHRKEGLLWAYEADIEDCFGSVRPELLLKEIHDLCGDVRMDNLILRHLQAGALKQGAKDRQHFGIPQGSPLSPLLANVYLHPFDQAVTNAGLALVRYADDLIVLADSEAAAERAGDQVEAALRQRYMRPNPDKTRIVDLHEGITFLGFSIDHRGERPAEKAIEGLKMRLKEERHGHRQSSPGERVAVYRSMLQGWRSYFRSFGSFVPEDPEVALAATEVALKRGDQEDAIAFIQPLTTARLPSLLPELKALRQQCGLSAEPPSGPPSEERSSIPLTSVAPPKPGEEAFLDKAIKSLRSFRKEQEEKRRNEQEQAAPQEPALLRIKQLRRQLHLDPDHLPLYDQLAEAYAQSGLYMLAESILKQAREKQASAHGSSSTTLAPTATPPLPADEPDQPERGGLPQAASAQPLILPEEIIADYLELFQGREGLLAQAQIQGNGKIHYQAVSRHLNEETLREHLEGKVAYALFPIMERDESQLGGLDVDITKRVLRAHAHDQDAMSRRLEEAKGWSLQLARIFHRMGVSILLEESGYKGYHLWFFLEQPMRPKRIRSFLRTVLKEAPEPPPGIVAELIPDRDLLNKHDTGHAIKLPLGIHPGSGKRAQFLAPETGLPIETQTALDEIKRTPPRLLEELLLERRNGIGLDNLDSRFPKVARLLDSCLILRRLLTKLEEIRHLNHHERLTLLYSVGRLPEEGEPFLHAAIGLCCDYDHAITQDFIRKGRPFPISCPRLREKHGDLLDGTQCNCFFRNLTKEAYPTPLLHVIPMRELFPKEDPPNDKKAPAKSHKKGPPNKKSKGKKKPKPTRGRKEEKGANKPKPTDADSAKESRDRLHELLHKLIAQRRHMRGIRRSIDRISEEMAEIFDQRGIEEFETDLGLLYRTKRDDGCWEWDIDI